MKIILGLGNPGKEYERTRHNIGFAIVDKFLGNVNYKEKFNALYYKCNIYNQEVIFVKPTTYMNLSGNALIKFIDYFDVHIDDILIIHDDLDMMIGTYKLKKNTSSGGHNGIKSIESVLKTKNFARFKIGILNENKKDVINFVLGKFSLTDMEAIMKIDTNRIISMFIQEGFDNIINKYKE